MMRKEDFEIGSIQYNGTEYAGWQVQPEEGTIAVRAVGQALKRNPLPIIFPCHRVIEADGSIGGYSSGVDIKRRFLILSTITEQVRVRSAQPCAAGDNLPTRLGCQIHVVNGYSN